MFGEPARCATHGTALTANGGCLLCMRRAPAKSSTLAWTIGLVVGAMVISALVFRVYVSIADRHAARAAAPATVAPGAVGPSGTDSPSNPSAAGTIPGTDRASPLAEARREVVIDLYGASWCGYCSRARTWLDREGIAYTYYDVDEPSNKPALRQLNARGSVPTIKIDDQVMVGWSEGTMRRHITRAAEARVARRGP